MRARIGAGAIALGLMVVACGGGDHGGGSLSQTCGDVQELIQSRIPQSVQAALEGSPAQNGARESRQAVADGAADLRNIAHEAPSGALRDAVNGYAEELDALSQVSLEEMPDLTSHNAALTELTQAIGEECGAAQQ